MLETAEESFPLRKQASDQGAHEHSGQKYSQRPDSGDNTKTTLKDMDKTQDSYTMEDYSDMKRNRVPVLTTPWLGLKVIRLSKRSQITKAICNLFPLCDIM